MAEVERRLAEIAERAKAATPGPWWVELSQTTPYEEWPGFRPSLIKYRWDDVPTWIAESSCRPKQAPLDFAFIAHARADVPWLLDRLAALREENARLREALEFYADANSYSHRGMIGEGRNPRIAGSPIVEDRGQRARAALAVAPSRPKETEQPPSRSSSRARGVVRAKGEA